MRTTIKLSIVFLFSISFFLLSSCSKDLSRDKAKQMIIQKYNFPLLKTINIDARHRYEYFGGSEMVQLNNFVSLGLVTQKKVNEYIPSVGAAWDFIDVSLTEEGKKYFVNEIQDNSDDLYGRKYVVKAYEIDFDEITGIEIQEQSKKARVLYTLKKVNVTPFGNLNEKSSTELNQVESFTLFDDGWRISN
ncbi:MAG: hypothetical protein NTZ33_06305 [Bacteroidetes bacterium]|nr:hypothetical protein [Bacteroidota bacterium]